MATGSFPFYLKFTSKRNLHIWYANDTGVSRLNAEDDSERLFFET